MGKSRASTAEAMLSEARADVVHADQKASVLLVALGVGFSAVLGGQLAGDFDSSAFTICGQWVWWIGVALAVTAVSAAALAVWPRYRLDDRPQFGITYWGHVASFKSLESLETALKDQDRDDARRVAHQLWRLSKLVLLKYRLVRAGLILGSAAGLALAIAAIVIR